MLWEKTYYVKEIMKKFGISRDTIKYYEKKGLIEPDRTENQYRVFDEYNVQKLKKILDYRDLGFTVDEIIDYNQAASAELRIGYLEDLRKRTEEKIRQLSFDLERINRLERLIGNDSRFHYGFNIDYNREFCIDCPNLEVDDRRKLFTRDALLLQMDQERNFAQVTECEVIRESFIMGERCKECKRKKWSYQKVYRRQVVFRGEEALKQTIQEAYFRGTELGYTLSDEILITKKVITTEEKESLIFDIFIPILP